jgi:hypothetical protein
MHLSPRMYANVAPPALMRRSAETHGHRCYEISESVDQEPFGRRLASARGLCQELTFSKALPAAKCWRHVGASAVEAL